MPQNKKMLFHRFVAEVDSSGCESSIQNWVGRDIYFLVLAQGKMYEKPAKFKIPPLF